MKCCGCHNQGCVWDPETQRGDYSVWVGVMVRSYFQKTWHLNWILKCWDGNDMVYESQVGILNSPWEKFLSRAPPCFKMWCLPWACENAPSFFGTWSTRLLRFPWASHTLSTFCSVNIWDGGGGQYSRRPWFRWFWQWTQPVKPEGTGYPDLHGSPRQVTTEPPPSCSSMSLVPAWMTLMMSRQTWILMGMRARWHCWCLMAGKVRRRSTVILGLSVASCHQNCTDLGPGAGTWFGEGLYLGEITRYYQVSENPGSVVGVVWRERFGI